MQKRILLIDDEPNVRLFYSDVLAEQGYKVLEADSGNDVVRLIESEVPDLVVLDLKLGRQNGLDVLQQIVCCRRDLPVILLTAYLSFQDDYTTWLADSYLLKSSDPGELLHEVDRVLNGPEQRATPQQAYRASFGASDLP
ncbi:MAG: response regulator [Acidobacteria bacterium]|nr:response regulator [Acidobacteriota bacterium]